MPDTDQLSQMFQAKLSSDEISENRFNPLPALCGIGVCLSVALGLIFIVIPKLVTQKTKNLTAAIDATKNKKAGVEKQISKDAEEHDIQLPKDIAIKEAELANDYKDLSDGIEAAKETMEKNQEVVKTKKATYDQTYDPLLKKLNVLTADQMQRRAEEREAYKVLADKKYKELDAKLKKRSAESIAEMKQLKKDLKVVPKASFWSFLN